MRNKYLGTIFILISAMIYGSYGFIARELDGTFGPFSQQYVQCFISGLLTLVLIIIYRTKIRPFNKKDVIPLFLLLLSSGSVTIVLYRTYQNLELGTVLLLYYSSMLLTGIVGGVLVFKEEFSIMKFISLTLSVLGIVLIYYSNIHFAKSSIEYVLLALIGGLAIGVYNLSSKKLSTNHPPMLMYFGASLAGILIAIFGAFLFKESLPILNISSAWGWIIIYSISAVVANIALFEGFKRLEAQTASIISITEVLVAIIVGLLIYSEFPTLQTLFGGILIVLANIVIILFQEKKRSMVF